MSFPGPPGASCSTRPRRAWRGKEIVPSSGLDIAGDQIEERRLAGTVAADEADMPALGKRGGRMIENEPRPEP